MQSKQTIEDKQEDEGDGPENAKGTTVFVKNLNFNTTEDALQKVLLFVLYISNCGLMSQKYQKIIFLWFSFPRHSASWVLFLAQ